MKAAVWAPRAKQVELVFEPDGERAVALPDGSGNFEVEHPRIVFGQRYRYSLDGGLPVPDPRSQSQPDGVHGPSEWVDLTSFPWMDQGFQQGPLGAAIIYELHVGTFSSEGTFQGAVEHLDHLVELGVTHVEIMPVAQFPGSRGWGYDGVDLFAPHSGYGGPRGLMELVNACHKRGLAVILDVVYNHLGPSGNYLAMYGPYFTSKYRTPWGDALNFDDEGSDQVRRFVCDNALFWLEFYHVDALRLDAVHAIFDQSARHILEQLAHEVDRLSLRLGRHLYLTAESALNDPRLIRAREQGGFGLHAQWNDDFHHALRTVLTGDTRGYYQDFGGLAPVAAALSRGFVYEGQYSRFRDRSFGAPLEGARGRTLIQFSQNHDQIGNRAQGERLAEHLDLGQLQIAAALTLLGPGIPMLFMGEEWGTSTPFQYFVDHSEPELQEAVRRGRQHEFVSFGWAPDDVPDPGALATFLRSKLDWSELTTEKGRTLRDFYRTLIRLRRTHPAFTDDRLTEAEVHVSEADGTLTFVRPGLSLLINFSQQERVFPRQAGRIILATGPERAPTGTAGLPTLPAHALAIFDHNPETIS